MKFFRTLLAAFTSQPAAATYTDKPVDMDAALNVPKDVREAIKAPDHIARMFNPGALDEGDAILMDKAMQKRARKGRRRAMIQKRAEERAAKQAGRLA